MDKCCEGGKMTAGCFHDNCTGPVLNCTCDNPSPYRPTGLCAPMMPINWCVNCYTENTMDISLQTETPNLNLSKLTGTNQEVNNS